MHVENQFRGSSTEEHIAYTRREAKRTDLQPRAFLLVCVAAVLLCFGCSSEETVNWGQVRSPDGKREAVVSCKQVRGIQLPGPEPARVKAQYVRLSITEAGKTLYSGDFERVGAAESSFAFDVVWAPDSKRLAYRMVCELRLVDTHGSYSLLLNSAERGALISSAKWTDNNELLVVWKEVDLAPKPTDVRTFWAYLTEATRVHVSTFDADTGKETERFSREVNRPTFLFHGHAFQMNEISPFSKRVAFSDGAALCVYDAATSSAIMKKKIDGKIEGIWWVSDSKVLLALGTLSSDNARFVTCEVPSGTVADCTKELEQYRHDAYSNDQLVRTVLQEK